MRPNYLLIGLLYVPYWALINGLPFFYKRHLSEPLLDRLDEYIIGLNDEHKESILWLRVL